MNELLDLKDRLRIIALKRTNVLKQAVSRQNMERIEKTSSGGGHHLYESKTLSPLQLDVTRAIKYASKMQKKSLEIDELSKPFSHIMNINYEQLTRDYENTMSRIHEFLRVDKQLTPLKSSVYKATPDDLRHALANYDELQAKVAGTELEKFLYE
jgi:LPS sulfotransferase NodH